MKPICHFQGISTEPQLYAICIHYIATLMLLIAGKMSSQSTHFQIHQAKERKKGNGAKSQKIKGKLNKTCCLINRVITHTLYEFELSLLNALVIFRQTAQGALSNAKVISDKQKLTELS